MKIEIERLTRDELLELYGKISVALDACETRRAAAAAAVNGRARELGFSSAAEVVTPPATEVRRIRYFNPENRAVSWNGRGRCPNWFKVEMAQGCTPDELMAR